MKRETKIAIGVIGVIIVAIAVLFATGIISQSALGGGFTVNSISATKVFTTESDVATGQFIVTATANGAQQSIVGRIDQTDFKRSGYDVQKGFGISIDALQENFQYPITRVVNEDLYQYKLVTVPSPSTFGTPVCPNPTITVYSVMQKNTIVGFPSNNKQIWCVEQSIVGATANLDNPTHTFDATLSVQVDGGTVQKVSMSSGGGSVSGSGSLGSLGTVAWTGNLLTGNTFSTPSNYKAIFNTGATNWHIINENDYRTYRTNYQQSINILSGTMQTQNAVKNQYGYFASVTSDDATINAFIGGLISPTNSALGPVLNGNVQIFNGQATSGTPSAGTLTVPSATRIANPQFVFYLNAKEVGVFVSSGTPAIAGLSCPTFESGSRNGLLTVNVRNIGSGTGTFEATATGCDFRVLSNQNTVSVPKDGTGAINLQIDTNTLASAKSTCTVTVKDTQSQKSTSDTVTCQATVPVTCTEGKQYLQGSNVMKCVGGILQLDFSCPSDIKADATGKLVCSTGVVPGPPPLNCSDALYGLVKSQPGDTEVCNFWCKVGLAAPQKTTVCVQDYTPLIIFIAVIVMVVALVIYKQVTKKGKRGKGGAKATDLLIGEDGILRMKGFWIAMALIVAFALVVGFFAYFFWAVVALSILGIIYVVGRGVAFRGKIRL